MHQILIPMPYGQVLAVANNNQLVSVSFVDDDVEIEKNATDSVCAQFEKQLLTYLENPKKKFTFDLAWSCSKFQQRVCQALADIPLGQVTSYGQIAKQLKTAPRAVGRACGGNPFALVFPCHRVVAANGEIGGFVGKTEGTWIKLKRWLLQHEGVDLKKL